MLKFKKMYLIQIGLSSIVLIGCGKKADSSIPQNMSDKIVKTETTKPETINASTTPSQTPAPTKTNPPAPRKLKALNLGLANNFSILAYASISSASPSIIAGKIGLFPAFKDQISIDPNDVKGGAISILGVDDETTPINLLSNAKVDMVSAYREAVSLTPDSDKSQLAANSFTGSQLMPGCYSWANHLVIDKNITLKGSSADVWIFKIPGNLTVSSGIVINLTGGALARNIFWQVSGSAVLESKSSVVGTIIAQQFIEMKNHSNLVGRIFAKNGFVTIDQAVINLP